MAELLERRGRLSLVDLWMCVPTMLVLGLVWSSVKVPVDFWIHVNSGLWMVEHGGHVERDWLTFTIFQEPVLNQPWLAQLALFGLVSLGGYALSQFVIGLVYGITIALITRLVYLTIGSGRMAAFLGSLSVLIMHNNLGIRPQAFATLLFVLELYILYRHLSCRWSVAAVGLISAFWANLHGSFPLGAALPVLFLTGGLLGRIFPNTSSTSSLKISTLHNDKEFGHSLWASIIAIGAMFCTPQTWSGVLYVIGVTKVATSYPIIEWIPTWKSELSIYFYVSFALCALVLLMSKKRLNARDVILLTAFTTLGFVSQRMLLWWAIVVPVVLTPYMVDISSRFTLRSSANDTPNYLNTLILGLFLALLLSFTPWARNANPLMTDRKRAAQTANRPDKALEYLDNSGFKGRLFLAMHHAAHASFVLGSDDVKVFADARLDIFPDRVWQQYFEIINGRNNAMTWLCRYGVDAVLVDQRRNAKLKRLLEESKFWVTGYRDAGFSVFHRN